LGKDFEISDQGNFSLFIEGAHSGRVSSGTEGSNLTESSDTVELIIIQDDISEPIERIHLHTKISQNIGCTIGFYRIDIDINDDDFPGNIQFEKSSYTVREDDGRISLKLNRVNGDAGTLSASVSTLSGSAADGEDYIGVTNKNVEFKGGVASQNLIIDVVKDHKIEALEDFTVSLTDSNGGKSSTKVIIEDSSNPGKAYFTSTTFNVEEGKSAAISVTRTEGSDGEFTVDLAVGGAGDSAILDEDYTVPDGTQLTWAAGDDGIKTISIPLLSDEQVEGDEKISLQLRQGETVLDDASLTIKDTTKLNPGIVKFTNEAFSGEEGASVEISVMREQGSDGEFLIDLVVGAEGDTAVAGEDYKNPETTQFIWAAGDDGIKTISIPLLPDDQVEGDEKISLQLRQGETVLGDASLTIKDATVIPTPGIVRFSSSTFEGKEGQRVEISALREQGSDGALSVDVGIGLEGDTAVAGEDYKIPETTQFNWAAGEDGIKTISIPLLSDEQVEGDEKISLQLRQGETVLGDTSLTIKDTTKLNPGIVKFTNEAFSGEEGASVEISVMREQGSDGEFLVDLVMGAEGDTAVAGEDYKNPEITQFVWAAGDDGIKTISIPLLSDEQVEGDEKISLQLRQGEAVLGDASLTIKDTTVLPTSGAAIGEVSIVDGKHQWGGPGLPQLSPFIVKVSGVEDEPLKGVNVTWTIDPVNGGSLSEGGSTATGAEGKAHNTFTVNTSERVVVTAIVDQNVNRRLRVGSHSPLRFIVNGDIIDTEDLSQNERSVAVVLDDSCAFLRDKKAQGQTLSFAENDLLATCDSLKVDDPTAVAEGLDLLVPDEVTAQGTAVIKASNLQVMNINARLNAVRNGATGVDLSGLSFRIEDQILPGYVINMLVNGGQAKGGAAGDIPGIAKRWGGFINGNISFGDKDDSDNETGFEFDSQGITVGTDYRLSSQAVIGAAVGISSNKSEFNNSSGSMEMDAVHLTAYGTYYKDERFYLDGLVKLGSNDYDTRRRVSYSNAPLQQAMGTTSGQELSFSLSSGYKNNKGAISYGPYGRVSYTKAKIDAYTESASSPNVTGSGSVLSLLDQDVDSLTAVLGGQFSYAISKPSGVYLPQLRFEWEHQFGDDSRDLSAKFVHDPTNSLFSISTDAPDRDYFNLGLGLTMAVSGGKSGYLFYETRLGQEDLVQHWIKAGLRFEFR
jgi:outer membrane autotransporter protein